MLPEEIGNLHLLKYLNCQHCLDIELPASIGKLQHLEYLDLSHCSKMESVPSEIRNVTSLKVLKLPHDIIWKETHAQQKLRYQEDFEADDGAAGLEDIACLVNLKTLLIPQECDVWSSDSPITLLSDAELEHLSISILGIQGLEWLELRHFFVADESKSLPELRILALCHARGMMVPRWLEGCHHLKYLSLYHCPTLEELPALDTLQDLENLHIYGCDKLKSIPSSFTRRNSFVSLVTFSCIECKNLELDFPEMECADTMPKLQTLELDENIRLPVHSRGTLAQKKLSLRNECKWGDYDRWQHSNLHTL